MPLILLPLLLTVAPVQDRPSAQVPPVFSPVKGASIDKSVDLAWKMTTTSYRVTTKQGSGPGTTGSSPLVNASVTGHIRVTDAYLDVSNERVTQLKRVLREVNYSLRQTDAPEESPRAYIGLDRKPSPFDARTVVFDWVPGQQTYRCADLDPTTSKSDPAILRQELDYTFALPTGAHDLREWSIDVNNIGNLLFPGGDLFPVRSTTKRPPADASSGDIRFGPAWVNMPTWQLLASPRGTIAASLKENQESGRSEQFISIVLKVDVDCRSDVSETMRRVMVDACIPEGRDYEFSQTSDVTLHGQGEIVWDLAKGRASSVSLSLNAMASDKAKLSLMTRNATGVLVPSEFNWSADWSGPFTLEFKADN